MKKNNNIKKINILFVIENRTFGGGERGFSQLINGIDSSKFSVFVATSPQGRFYREIVGTDVFIIPLQFGRKMIFRTIRLLMNTIRNNTIHIVHSQGAWADFLARIAGHTTRARLITTTQMPVEGFDVPLWRKCLYIILDRITEKYVNRFVVVSDHLKNVLMHNHHIPKYKVIKIHNGIEIEHYSPDQDDQNINKIKNEFHLDNDTVLVGAIGRLVWQKGFEYLIRAIPEITKAYPNVKVLIVGDGPLKEQLIVISEKLKVRDKIIFTGFRNDIKEILSAIDILVIPSLLEGFPMITLEAMAMAKPIIATEIDGITEQIKNGESGILVPQKDSYAIANAIIKILNDKELIGKLSINARKRVEENFTMGKMVSETAKIYCSLLSHR